MIKEIYSWSEIEAQGVGDCIVSYFLCFVFDITIQIHFLTIFKHSFHRYFSQRTHTVDSKFIVNSLY